MLREKLITPDQNAKLREQARNSVREALKTAADLRKPPIEQLFLDTYHEVPVHLKEQ